MEAPAQRWTARLGLLAPFDATSPQPRIRGTGSFCKTFQLGIPIEYPTADIFQPKLANFSFSSIHPIACDSLRQLAAHLTNPNERIGSALARAARAVETCKLQRLNQNHRTGLTGIVSLVPLYIYIHADMDRWAVVGYGRDLTLTLTASLGTCTSL